MLQESLIYKFIYGIYGYFAQIWPDSLIARIAAKVGTFFKALFSGSAIWNFLTREGSINRAYEGSLLFRFVEGLLNLPQKLLHRLYEKAEPVLTQNALFKVVLFYLDRLHLLLAAFIFIVLVTPHQYYYNKYSTIAVLAILALFFLRTIVDGKTGFRTAAFNVYLVVLVICVLLAQVTSIMPGSSLRFLIFYLTCFLLVFLVIAAIRSKKDMIQFLTVILVGLSIAGVYGVYQQVVGVPVNPAWVDTTTNQGDLTRVYSFFYNPNNFAEIILMMLPFYFAAFFTTKGVLKKLAYLALACPPLLSLIFTQARSAWLALPIVGLVYLFFKEKRLIPVFLVLGVAMIPFLPQSILLRLKSIDFANDSSLQTRMQVWQSIIPIIKDYWFTGLGLGNETLLRVSKNYYIFVKKGSIPSHSHNVYFQLWLETGLPGILAYLAFIGTTLKKSIRALYQGVRDAFVNNILIAGIAALVGILAVSLAEYVWFYQRTELIFWVLIGLLLAALNIGREETAMAMEGSAGGNRGEAVTSGNGEDSGEEEQDVAV